MSDDSETRSASNGNGPVAGQVLARARRAREISIQEIAKDLHLDEPKVRALENNEFDLLGAPVFAKGYLRKYAELVGVPVDDIVADYYRLNRSVGAPPLVTKRERPLRESSAAPWIVLLALLVIVGLAGTWWFTSGADSSGARDRVPDDAVPAGSEEASAPGPDHAPAAAATGPAIVSDDAPVGPGAAPQSGESQAATSAPPAPAAAVPQPVVAEGMLQLRLAFSGDCWTEVTDAGGSRLYFGLGASGDEVTVAGEPPLNVLLGDSANVAVFVDGSAYPIPASARRGETARLTLIPR